MTKILTKLHAIMADVSYIKKDKRNSFYGYTYASEAAIKEKLHESLVKHGVLFFPVSATITGHTEYRTEKDKRSSITDVLLKYRFYDVETGESVEGECTGSGDDGADKGTYKAITGAIKYVLTSTFLIETGDDPESDEPAPASKTAPKPAPAATPTKPPVGERQFAATKPATKTELMEIVRLAEVKLGAKAGDGKDMLEKLNTKFGFSLVSRDDINHLKADTIIKALGAMPDVDPLDA